MILVLVNMVVFRNQSIAPANLVCEEVNVLAIPSSILCATSTYFEHGWHGFIQINTEKSLFLIRINPCYPCSILRRTHSILICA